MDRIYFLDVYLKGVFVGKLKSQNAALGFSYTPEYLQSDNPIKLSASLPLSSEEFDHSVVAPYFSGLLPDEDVRRRLAKYLQISEKNTFFLLKEVGGECAGAVSLYEEGVTPDSKSTNEYRVLSSSEASDILKSLDKKPFLAGEDDIRLSGAGAQDKLVISFVDGQMAIPKGNTPSTHIIKPAIKGINSSVHNEFFCMKLAKRIGLPVPDVSILWVDNIPYYVIERYDRIFKDGKVIRLHQEDFCQALHISPEIKYESEGGPSLIDCFNLLNQRIQSGSMRGVDKLTLLKGVIFNYLIGNGDAHGKNFSILYYDQAESLAPFYDLLSTIVYKDYQKEKMAMKIGKKYKFENLYLASWEQFAEKIGIKKRLLYKNLLQMSDLVFVEAQKLIEELNLQKDTESEIYEKILRAIERHSKVISALITNKEHST